MTLLTTVVLSLLSCAPRTQPEAVAPPPPPAPATQEDSVALETVTGSAQDAKGGAMVVREDGQAFYVVGLASWPAHARGKQVRVTGEVGAERYVPESVTGPDGLVSQGVSPGSAPDDVVRVATWALVDAPAGAEPAPWRLTIADGSANRTVVWQQAEGEAAQWSYDPVTPEESSTGHYSGGTPGEGTADPAEVDALWQTVRALEGWPAVHATARAKGTVAIDIVSPAGDRAVLVELGEHLGPITAAVLAIRTEAAPSAP